MPRDHLADFVLYQHIIQTCRRHATVSQTTSTHLHLPGKLGLASSAVISTCPGREPLTTMVYFSQNLKLVSLWTWNKIQLIEYLISGTDFFFISDMPALSITQLTASKHWRNHRSLTQPVAWPYPIFHPPSDSWRNGYRLLYTLSLFNSSTISHTFTVNNARRGTTVNGKCLGPSKRYRFHWKNLGWRTKGQLANPRPACWRAKPKPSYAPANMATT